METKYKPYILLVLFSIAVITLEMAVYGEEITQSIDEGIYGISGQPTMPSTYIEIPIVKWRVPDIWAWFTFFISVLGYIFLLLGIALTLPVSDIPMLIKVVLLAPIWIMTIILVFNAIKTFLRAIGAIIPTT